MLHPSDTRHAILLLETVIVNGEIMVEDGKLTRVDEDALLDELREMMPGIMAEQEQLEERNRPFLPLLAEVWQRCAENRYRHQPLGQRQRAALAEQQLNA